MEGLFDGLRVIDLSLWQPGHYATQLLADLGAEVLKVEPPGGDRMRVLPDRFTNFNGRKKTVLLDLKNVEELTDLKDLVRGCDVVVEGFRPGVATRLGVGFSDLEPLNPALVYCSITGYGQTGPLAHAPGHDWNYQGYAGAMRGLDGDAEPAATGALVADHGGGLAAAFGILAAVLCARRTGVGEHIDVSMADLVASWVFPMGPIDAAHASTAPPIEAPAHGVFAVADGHVVLGVYTEDTLWKQLCAALELEEFAGLGLGERTARAHELRAIVAERLKARHRDELVRSLGERLPISPVLSREEALNHPHFEARGVVVTHGPDGLRRLGHPIRFERHPALPPGPAPSLPSRRRRRPKAN